MTTGVETITGAFEFRDNASQQLNRINSVYFKFERRIKNATTATNRQTKASSRLRDGLKLLGVAAAGVAAVRLARGLFSWAEGAREATVAAFDLANTVGASTEAISTLNFAAEQNGIEVKAVESALRALSRRAAALPKNFSKWNIETRNVNGTLVDNEELLRRVSDRIQRASSRAEQFAIADETLSEAGRKLVPVLADGARGLDAWRREAERVGAVIDQETANRIKFLDDRLTDLRASSAGLAREFFGSLAPGLSAIAQAFLDVARSASQASGSFDIGGGFIRTLETLGQVIIPTVVSSTASLIKAFIILRAPVAVLATVVGVAAKGWVLLGQTLVQGLALLERLATDNGPLQRTADKLIQLATNIGKFNTSIANLVKNTSADITLIGQAAKTTADSIIEATRKIAEAARSNLTAEPQAAPSGDVVSPDAPESARIKAIKKEIDFVDRLDARWRVSIEERLALSKRFAETIGGVLGQVAQQELSLEEALSKLGVTVIQLALQFIAAEAAKGAAAAFSSQAGIPIVGPILGAVAAAAVFAAISAFAGTFHDGGIVGPNGRIPTDLTRPLGPDERFARVQVGERIVPRNQAPGGPGGGGGGGGPVTLNVTLGVSTLALPGRAAIARSFSREVVPAIRESLERDGTTFDRRTTGRALG